jgi:hypothetical protein
MIAGKGWIACSLHDIRYLATRTGNVVLTSLAGVTMLQFHLQASRVDVPSQFLSMLPDASTIVVLCLISKNREGGYALTCQLRLASPSTPLNHFFHHLRRSIQVDFKNVVRIVSASVCGRSSALVACGKRRSQTS